MDFREVFVEAVVVCGWWECLVVFFVVCGNQKTWSVFRWVLFCETYVSFDDVMYFKSIHLYLTLRWGDLGVVGVLELCIWCLMSYWLMCIFVLEIEVLEDYSFLFKNRYLYCTTCHPAKLLWANVGDWMWYKIWFMIVIDFFGLFMF